MIPRDEVRSLFPGLDHTIYLNTAALAIGSVPVREAYQRALEAWVNGTFSFVEAERAGEECRAMFARLVGAMCEEIALVPAVSTAAGIVAAQLGPARTGESIIVGAEEFTSNFLPWSLLRDLGYEVRLVPFQNGSARTEDYARHVDARTRLLAVSAVQSASGQAADLPALAELIHQAGGWLFVDAAQAAGAVPIEVRASGVDFLAAPSHKFLCGTRGMGYLFVREDLLPSIRPLTPGWKAAREPFRSFYGPEVELSAAASKLDTSLPWFAALGEREALRLFERFGTEAIFEKNHQLVRSLKGVLQERGFNAGDPDASAPSTIVSIPVQDAETVLARFAEANVVASARAGRIRISIHFYNETDELEMAADLLAAGGIRPTPPFG